MTALEIVKKMGQPVSMPQRSGAAHEVEFTFRAPEARKVYIAGSFNSWNTSSTPMKKGKDGIWRLKLKLSSGKYEYKYFVDGTWASDQSCSEMAANSFGTKNCVISVH